METGHLKGGGRGMGCKGRKTGSAGESIARPLRATPPPPCDLSLPSPPPLPPRSFRQRPTPPPPAPRVCQHPPFPMYVCMNVQWREANRRRQRQANEHHGLVPPPPPPAAQTDSAYGAIVTDLHGIGGPPRGTYAGTEYSQGRIRRNSPPHGAEDGFLWPACRC